MGKEQIPETIFQFSRHATNKTNRTAAQICDRQSSVLTMPKYPS